MSNSIILPTSKEAGVTLIEVLASILLLGVIATFIAMAIPTSVSVSSRTDNLESSTVIAQKLIEDIKAQHKNDAQFMNYLTDGSTSIPFISLSDYTNNGEYTVSAEVLVFKQDLVYYTWDVLDPATGNIKESIDNPTVPYLASIIITVSPTDIDREGETVHLETYLKRKR